MHRQSGGSASFSWTSWQSMNKTTLARSMKIIFLPRTASAWDSSFQESVIVAAWEGCFHRLLCCCPRVQRRSIWKRFCQQMRKLFSSLMWSLKQVHNTLHCGRPSSGILQGGKTCFQTEQRKENMLLFWHSPGVSAVLDDLSPLHWLFSSGNAVSGKQTKRSFYPQHVTFI